MLCPDLLYITQQQPTKVTFVKKKYKFGGDGKEVIRSYPYLYVFDWKRIILDASPIVHT